MDRKIEKRKWPPRKIATLAASALFFIIIVYNISFGDRSTKLNVETQKITISEVRRGPFQEYIPVTGNVLPIKTIFLDATEGGRVDTVYIEAGSFVKAGDKILLLENRNLHIQIMSQDALVLEQRNLLTGTRFNMEQNRINLRQRLLDQEYQLQRLNRLFERRKELFERSLISQEEFEATKDEFDYQKKTQKLNVESYRQDSLFQHIQIRQLENSLIRLEDNLKIVRTRLDDLTVTAPITGQLTSLIPEAGQTLAQGERIGQVDNLDGFKVRAGIDEHYLARIGKGQKGEFDFAGKTYKLITDRVYPEVRNGRFEVDLKFVAETPQGIRRGQTLHIRLELGDLTEAVLIPRGGFYQKTGGQWIYVVDESGDFTAKRRIRLGRQNPQVFEVLSGLEPGERVVTSSYDSYGDIDKLILQE